MPTYAYRGKECPHEFEVYQSFSENALTECVECGKPVRRVIHPAGIVFKGSGWYITDSRNGGKPADGENKTAKPEKTDSKSDSKTETTSNKSTKAPEPATACAKD
ncbi:MAG TPA: FmdB family zinc ribbon protein [Thermomicrobiales bacterium]|nr:FmdB family zinc ribbon protein [Thermomicrobiales bacterium]